MSRLMPLVLLLAPVLVLAGDSPPEDTAEARALAAFTARDFESGVAQFRALRSARPEDPRAPFWEMMVVRGLALAGKDADAAVAGAGVLGARPQGPWSNAVRFLVADALVNLGEEKKAAATALAGLDALLAPEARARVADLYLAAADRALEGVAVGDGPFRRAGKPDHAAALALLRGARTVGLRSADEPTTAAKIVRCLIAMNAHGDAANEASGALKRHASAPNRLELLALRALAFARAGWKDDARQAIESLLAAAPGDSRAAEALMALGDIASLTIVRDRLGDAPQAPLATLGIARKLEKAGDAEKAIEAYRIFLARYPKHDEAAVADFQIAEILLGMGEHDVAARAFLSHRERFPLSRHWTRARVRATDAVYLKGKALRDEGKHAEAYAKWRAFVKAYPLSPRVPGLLESEGDWHAKNDRAEKAYAVWHELRTRYRTSPEASRAALRIAKLFEATVGDVARAVTEYRAVTTDFPKSKAAAEARSRLKILQEEHLAIRLPRAFRSDEKAHLRVDARNVESLTVRVYDIDLAEYFRRRRTLSGLDDVLVDVIKPDEILTHEVPGYERYRETRFDLPIPRQGPGGAIVVVEGGSLRAMTLMLVSDITVVTKEWRGGALAFVQDARTGKPLAGVDVLASRGGRRLATAVTGEDGTARLGKLANPVRLVALHGASVASDEFESMRRNVQGSRTLAHISTDRPLYRPGHEVRYRAIVRYRTGDTLVNPAGKSAVVRVLDGKDNELYADKTRLSAHGTTHGAFRLPPDLPPGDYRIHLFHGNGSFSGMFRVEEYTKPDVLLSLDLERPYVIRGETIRGTLRARYAFGKPIAGLSLQTNRIGTRTTDAAGEIPFELASAGRQAGRLTVAFTGQDVARRRIGLQRVVVVAERGYQVALTPDPARPTAGEELRVTVSVLDPLGEPTARKGVVRVLRAEDGADLFRPVMDPVPVATDETGLTTLRLRLDRPGRYRLRYEGEDRLGNPVETQSEVTVTDARDTRRIVVNADRDAYGEGETAQVAIRAPGVGYALVTTEGERVYGHRVVRFEGESRTVPLAMDAACVPEVRIRVAMAHDGNLWKGEDHVRVTRTLRVEIRAGAEKYAPGDTATVEVVTTDGRGEPVSAELALAVVDEAIYALREDCTTPLARFFTPPARADLVQTGSSLDFAYAGVSSRISEDLLAERDRRRKKAKDAVMLEEEVISDDPFEGPETNSAIGIGGGAGGSFGGRSSRRNLRAEGGGATRGGPWGEVRKDFADTAYWSGALVTGPDGKARVTFRVPDNLTTWRVTGRAVTVGGGAGDGEGSFRSAKDLAVLINVPPVMRDGDAVIGSASLHNASGEALESTVSLEARESLYGPFAGASRSLPVGADVALDWRLEAPRHGRGVVAAAVRAGDRADAEQRTVRVLAYGVPVRMGIGGALDAPVDWRFEVPDDVVPGTLSAQLRLAPSVTAQVLAGLDHLDAFPYGCVEQTVNRFYPALMAARALRDLGRDEPRLRARLDDAVKAGIRRLSYLQRHDGAWAWWRRGAANSYMTAYATLALATARAEEYPVPERVLAAARNGIQHRLKVEKDENLRAFLRYALMAGAKKPDLSALADSYARRSKLEARGLSWLALAYARLGADLQAETLARELARRVETTKDGARVRAMSTGGGSRLEASALALQALLATGVEPALADGLALGLASARRDGSFGTTIETGAAVLALSRYLARYGSGDGGCIVEVRVNDAEPVVVKLSESTMEREQVVPLPADVLKPGANRVRVFRRGGSRSVFALSVNAVTRTAPDPDDGEPDVVLARNYAIAADASKEPISHRMPRNILRPGGTRREPDVSAVEVGDLICVTLDVRVRPGLRYLQIEDPLPAGFTSVDGTVAGPVTETVPREDRLVFFVADPPARFQIVHVMRAGFPGEVRTPSGRAFPMYRPEIVAYSDPREVRVDLPGKVERAFAVGLSPEHMLLSALAAEESDPERAARFARVLLERFDVNDASAAEMLHLLARVSERLGRPEDVVDAYDRLAVLQPGVALPLDASIRQARAATAVDRPAVAIQAVRRAVGLLYQRDRKALGDLEGRAAIDGLLTLFAGRYPFGPMVGADLTRHAYVSADRYDARTRVDEPADPALLEPLVRTRALYPTTPGAARLALRHARSRLRESNWVALEREAALVAELYPDHVERAEADWFHAFAVFAQERYEEAIDLSRRAHASRKYRLANGRRGASTFRRNHAHLLAQAFHIRGDMEKALRYYRELEHHSADAASVVQELSATHLSIPSRLRVRVGETPELEIRTRNHALVKVRAYPIDLLSYFAIRKDLAKLASINLDGLEPAVTTKVEIPNGKDRERHVTPLALDLKGPGVYLVLAEAGGEVSSGVVMISDLTVKVWAPSRGEARARVVVTDVATGKPVKGAHVKVARGGKILAGGVTDARGVFDTLSVVRSKSKRQPAPLEEMPVEISEYGPGGNSRVMVVVEKEGHAAAWW